MREAERAAGRGLIRTTTGRRGARRTGGALAAVLAAVLLVAAAQGCDREVAPQYGGDPEGRIVTAGNTADELVTRGETARRVADVELSEELVERWFIAQDRLDELASIDPYVRDLLGGGDGGGTRGAGAIDDAVSRLGSDPRVRAVIEDSGLSTRDFVLTALALHQALLASSPGAPPQLRALARRNARFVDQNAALLERLAMPRPSRMLAYDDTAPFVDPFVDTLTPYGEAPYDPYLYPAPAWDDTLAPPPYDTALVVEPPVIDTVLPPSPPPVVATPLPPTPPVRAAPPVVPPMMRTDSGGTVPPGADSSRGNAPRVEPPGRALPPPGADMAV